MFGRREHGVGGVAVPAGEVVAAHAVLVLEVSNGGSTAERLRKARLMAAQSPRFWPATWTLKRFSLGALWPR